MITVRVSLNRTSKQGASVFATPQGFFISLELDEELSVYLPGFGQESATYARAVAKSLVEAADSMDRRLEDAARVKA